MTSSPDLIHELRASRPSAPPELRARVREIATASRSRILRGKLALPGPARRARRGAGGRRARVRERRRARARPLRRPAHRVARDAADRKTLARVAPTTAQRRLAPTQGAADAAHRTSARSASARRSRSRCPIRTPCPAPRRRRSTSTRSLGGYVVSSSVATGEEGRRRSRFGSRSARCRRRSRASPVSAASSRSR